MHRVELGDDILVLETFPPQVNRRGPGHEARSDYATCRAQSPTAEQSQLARPHLIQRHRLVEGTEAVHPRPLRYGRRPTEIDDRQAQ